MSDAKTGARLERPDEPVSVPRWVLDELVPMALGSMKLLTALREAGRSPDVSDAEMARGTEAIEIAFEALHGKDATA